MNNEEVSTIERDDVNLNDIKQPTLDLWKVRIHQIDGFDPVVFIFATTFNTIMSRRGKNRFLLSIFIDKLIGFFKRK